MTPSDDRLVDWFDLLRALLQRPLSVMPVDDIARLMATSFAASAVSLNSGNAIGKSSYRAWLPDGVADPYDSRIYCEGGALERHPLVRWATIAGLRPQTMRRVPLSVADPRMVHETRDVLRQTHVVEQMAIPLRFDAGRHVVFTVGRPTDDFDDRDLALAQTIQPVLAGILVQTETLVAWRRGNTVVADDVVSQSSVRDLALTGREVAVLHLVAEGLTSTSIGRRLRISGRTAEKHLERAYGKLGVHDRMSAVMTAQRLGVLPAQRQAPLTRD